eukprot:TRINITY_DN3880_c0_g2_i1.p1 TRINITY_DN3880_c0_g2~~TRINITY_DN3880_c0_g2_i1.p1  ORF type:complete len:289 (+),score=38.14 TRINITY_DN3880_c0_g2_i1:75-869(+)
MASSKPRQSISESAEDFSRFTGDKQMHPTTALAKAHDEFYFFSRTHGWRYGEAVPSARPGMICLIHKAKDGSTIRKYFAPDSKDIIHCEPHPSNSKKLPACREESVNSQSGKSASSSEGDAKFGFDFAPRDSLRGGPRKMEGAAWSARNENLRMGRRFPQPYGQNEPCQRYPAEPATVRNAYPTNQSYWPQMSPKFGQFDLQDSDPEYSRHYSFGNGSSKPSSPSRQRPKSLSLKSNEGGCQYFNIASGSPANYHCETPENWRW